MRSAIKAAFLAAVIVAALTYVAFEHTRSTPEPPSGSIAAQPAPSPIIEPATQTTPVSFAEPERVQTAVASVLSDEEQTNVDIYDRLSPGVVNITSTSYTYDFFYQAIPQSGSGSGVVLDGDGHIVTNYHVIENAVENAVRYRTAPEIEVTLADQSRHQATVVGVDPSNDLAVIRVDSPDIDWTPVPFGSVEGLRVGQKVLAIGNPFGLDRTLTTGIISSLGRAIEATNGRIIEGIIQTDAAINPGNSGGPLLNTRGEIIGINTAIVSGASGVGFAVPVSTVRRVTHDLVTYGHVRRAYLIGEGNLISLSSLGRDVLGYLDLGTTSGVMIVSAPRGTPAAAAGLRGATEQLRYRNYVIPANGDVIVRVADRAVRSSSEIATVLESYQPADSVEVTVVRDGSPLSVTVDLGEEPVG